jgi:hypothetical protein
MISEKIESFLEKADMNYLFCLLSKLESQRISKLPSYVRQRFEEKITVMAMHHVAENEVPDYIAEIAEDILLALVYDLNGTYSLYAGYRFLEGGSDIEEVYTFANINYLSLGTRINF